MASAEFARMSRTVSFPAESRPVAVWYCADVRSGLILAELPIAGATAVTVSIGREDTLNLTLPTADPACPPDWAQVLVPGKVALVLTLDDLPVQAWSVIETVTGGDTVSITLATMETWAARTNVPDVDVTATDDAEIAALVATPLVGCFGVWIDWTATGHTSDVFFDATEDRSILSALADMMAVQGGPEWRFSVLWADPAIKTAFTWRLSIAPRIGGVRPDALFSLDEHGHGNVLSYTRTRSYAAGRGATSVIATTDGAGASRPMSDPVLSTLIADGWPTWQARVNAPGLSDVGDLDAALLSRASEVAATQALGTITWSVVGDEHAPRPGRDFDAGDTVFLDVASQGVRDPIGTGTQVPMRVIGWTLDLVSGQVTPLLWDDEGVS